MKTCVLLGLAFCLFGISCKKSDDTSTGGKGGNGILKVTPRHHTRPIDSCTIYIKYNAVDAPANGVYDDSAKCVQEGGLPVATFTSLKKGNYYLFGYGWDPQLSPPQHVKGGYAYQLQQEITQTTDLAVTED
jgi:hypothetical protein